MERFRLVRYLSEILNVFSEKKIVLLAGPRQSGKTTLSKFWLKSNNGKYLNWDIPEDRSEILAKEFMAKQH